MTHTTTEIRNEAERIIKDVFPAVLTSDNKEAWKNAMEFIDKKIFELEIGDRGFQMFAWEKAKRIMNDKFGKKFIKKPAL